MSENNSTKNEARLVARPSDELKKCYYQFKQDLTVKFIYHASVTIFSHVANIKQLRCSPSKPIRPPLLNPTPWPKLILPQDSNFHIFISCMSWRICTKNGLNARKRDDFESLVLVLASSISNKNFNISIIQTHTKIFIRDVLPISKKWADFCSIVSTWFVSLSCYPVFVTWSLPILFVESIMNCHDCSGESIWSKKLVDHWMNEFWSKNFS